jgi:hypothetical protein
MNVFPSKVQQISDLCNYNKDPFILGQILPLLCHFGLTCIYVYRRKLTLLTHGTPHT